MVITWIIIANPIESRRGGRGRGRGLRGEMKDCAAMRSKNDLDLTWIQTTLVDNKR